MSTVKTKTINLGRLPVYCGCWNQGVGYHKYNIVTYYGSSFINLVEGNTKAPVTIQFDSSNRIASYEFKDEFGSWTGWLFVANAMDASIYAMEMGDYAKYEGDRAKKIVDDNFFALTIDEYGDIWGEYYLEGHIKNAYVDEIGDIVLVFDNSSDYNTITSLKKYGNDPSSITDGYYYYNNDGPEFGSNNYLIVNIENNVLYKVGLSSPPTSHITYDNSLYKIVNYQATGADTSNITNVLASIKTDLANTYGMTVTIATAKKILTQEDITTYNLLPLEVRRSISS